MTAYTVRRCRKNGKPYGPCHGSEDGWGTLCGEVIDSDWVITNNSATGKITCKECLRIERAEDE